ncbi:MAG TPA: tetratricopeptide repeat protein [Steroidobacteraceae bacterium]|nr:tetratricopeptide repeat protein [Steroidobacteraceae bacterium]
MATERAPADVFDTSTANFARDVIERSRKVTVAVDFWAPWCAPCRALAPILDDLVRQYAGRLQLARVNTDAEPALAAQFAIRSIPDVRIFRDGRMVDGFVGVQPLARLKPLFDKHVTRASEGGRDEARNLLLKGDAPGAVAMLRQLVERDPDNAAARIDLADALTRTGAVEEAQQILDALPPNLATDKAVDAVRARIYFVKHAAPADAVPALQGKVAAGTATLEEMHRLAAFELLFGDPSPALELLLTIMRRDRKFQDDLGRKSLVQAFYLLADADERVAEYRRRMTALLY